MLKLKNRKSAQKRYKKTGTGKFLRRHAYKGHLLMHKSKKQNVNCLRDFVSVLVIVNL